MQKVREFMKKPPAWFDRMFITLIVVLGAGMAVNFYVLILWTRGRLQEGWTAALTASTLTGIAMAVLMLWIMGLNKKSPGSG